MTINPCMFMDCSVTIAVKNMPNVKLCFNGHPEEFYEAVGEKCPIPPQRCTIGQNLHSQVRDQFQAPSKNHSSAIQIHIFPSHANPFKGDVIVWNVVFRQMQSSTAGSMSSRQALEKFRNAVVGGKLATFAVALKIGEDFIYDKSVEPILSTNTSDANGPGFPMWAIALLVAIVASIFICIVVWRFRLHFFTQADSAQHQFAAVESVLRTPSNNSTRIQFCIASDVYNVGNIPGQVDECCAYALNVPALVTREFTAAHSIDHNRHFRNAENLIMHTNGRAWHIASASLVFDTKNNLSTVPVYTPSVEAGACTAQLASEDSGGFRRLQSGGLLNPSKISIEPRTDYLFPPNLLAHI